MTASYHSTRGLAAGDVGLVGPGRPITRGRDRLFDIMGPMGAARSRHHRGNELVVLVGRATGRLYAHFLCADLSPTQLPLGEVSAAPAGFTPLAGRRTQVCGGPRQSCQCNQRGTHGTAAFFFQPSDDATDDRVQSDHARNRGPRCFANQCLSSDTTGRD